jgi:hypothetical protein
MVVFRVLHEQLTARQGALLQGQHTCTNAVSLSLPSALAQKPLMTCVRLIQVSHQH